MQNPRRILLAAILLCSGVALLLAWRIFPTGPARRHEITSTLEPRNGDSESVTDATETGSKSAALRVVLVDSLRGCPVEGGMCTLGPITLASSAAGRATFLASEIRAPGGQLRISARGFKDEVRYLDPIPYGTVLVIPLDGAGTVRGRVLTIDGLSLAGASVGLAETSHERWTISAVDGSFELHGLAVGSREPVTAALLGYEPATEQVFVREETQVEFRLQRTSAITVRVRAPTLSARNPTDAIPTHPLDMAIMVGGKQLYRGPVELRNGEGVLLLQAAFERGAQAEATVYWPTGGTSTQRSTVRSDRDGTEVVEFCFDNVSHRRVRFEAPDRSSIRGPVFTRGARGALPLAVGENSEAVLLGPRDASCDVPLQFWNTQGISRPTVLTFEGGIATVILSNGGGTIVVSAGDAQTIDGLELIETTLGQVQAPRADRQLVTSVERIFQLPRGTYRLVMRGVVLVESMAVYEGSQERYDHSPALSTGSVIGTVASDCCVRAWASDAQLTSPTATLNASGRFRIEELRAGEYIVQFAFDQDHVVSRRIAVQEGVATDIGTIAPTDARHYRVAISSGGQALEGAKLAVSTSPQVRALDVTTLTDRLGIAHVPLVDNTPLVVGFGDRFWVLKPDCVDYEFEVRRAPQQVTVKFPRELAVTDQVLWLDAECSALSFVDLPLVSESAVAITRSGTVQFFVIPSDDGLNVVAVDPGSSDDSVSAGLPARHTVLLGGSLSETASVRVTLLRLGRTDVSVLKWRLSAQLERSHPPKLVIRLPANALARLSFHDGRGRPLGGHDVSGSVSDEVYFLDR